jgi:hypothetical protein
MNFRRAANFGKVYLIMGIVLGIVMSALYLSVPTALPSGTTQVPEMISQIPALLLPIFAVIGSFGSLMIFVSDKDKGVYEYLIAYGVEPSRIFWSIALGAIGLVSVVLGISICANVAIALVRGALSLTYVEILIFYVIPISYAVTVFMNMAGMIWSSLAVRRSGINSPVGVISIIGVIPSMATLMLSFVVPPTYFIILVGAISLALFVVVGAMIRVANSKMVRERFLSTA